MIPGRLPSMEWRGWIEARCQLILAHEMVHALQHQYLPLDSILRPQDDDDRQLAAHSILEGQATLASIKAFLPAGTTVPPEIWTQTRDQLASAQASSPRFAAAPLVIREQLLFPYLEGADFMMWWEASPFSDTLALRPAHAAVQRAGAPAFALCR